MDKVTIISPVTARPLKEQDSTCSSYSLEFANWPHRDKLWKKQSNL